MTGSTLIIELHALRRPGIYGGELGRALCLGVVTITWMPILLNEWLKEKFGALREVAGTRGFVEMAAYDDSPDNANERADCSKVPGPWGGKPIHSRGLCREGSSK